jgi:hypothetical protein
MRTTSRRYRRLSSSNNISNSTSPMQLPRLRMRPPSAERPNRALRANVANAAMQMSTNSDDKHRPGFEPLLSVTELDDWACMIAATTQQTSAAVLNFLLHFCVLLQILPLSL